MPAEVSVDDLATAIETGAWVLDVREPDEFEAGHVPAAHHVPLATVADNLALIPTNEVVYCVCKAGGRSMKAATMLEERGYQVVSVAGGTDGWAASGRDLSFEASL